MYYYLQSLFIKPTIYTQDDFENLDGQKVVAYVKNTGWVYGKFKFNIHLENFVFKTRAGKEQNYCRRLDTYIINDIVEKLSYIIWLDDNSEINGQKFQNDPEGNLIPADKSNYFISSKNLLYIVQNEDDGFFEYVKSNVVM